ncbi:MAG: YegP family protein [Flavobacteriales bacterium]|nr:YegP family protein [Flavobacteriales bacterium]
MATFELYTDKAGQHRFRLKADNGQIILAGEGYGRRSSARNGIASVRRNASDDHRFERKHTRSGWSFNLKAANGQVIGTSEVYDSEPARENGIASVKKAAAKAGMKEL